MNTKLKQRTDKRASGSERNIKPALQILHIIKTIFILLLVIVAVAMMVFTIVSVTTFDRNDRDFFGYKAFIVRSDSMSATDFEAGDLIFVEEVDPATLQVGDIIAYQSTATESFGETVTHKIRSITTDQKGSPAFITYGTTTDTDDEIPVTYEYVQGKYSYRLAGIGNFFLFLKTTPGYICCILLPFLLLIAVQGINTVYLYRQYKRQQQEEMQKERDSIAAERSQAQRMIQELEQMRAEMGLTKEAEH